MSAKTEKVLIPLSEVKSIKVFPHGGVLFLNIVFKTKGSDPVNVASALLGAFFQPSAVEAIRAQMRKSLH